MSNPMADARAQVAAALAGLTIPVHDIPPGAVSGPFVVIVADEVDPRGHVTLTATMSAPLASARSAVETVEQGAWDIRQAVGAAGLGWLAITRAEVDTDAQRLSRSITVTTRP